MQRTFYGFALALVCLIAADAIACSCKAPPPPAAALEQAAAVFQAKVSKIEEAGFTKTVTLKVERWWKGGDADTIVVSTAKSGAACGYGFRQDERYLVYAHAAKGDQILRVSLCSRTRSVDEAVKSGDFKELGAGRGPR